MIECICDICAYKGPATEFLWPRNNEPTFTSSWDLSMDRRSIKEKRFDQGQPVTYLESDDLQDVWLYMKIHVEPSGPETTVCRACFFAAIDSFVRKYGPEQPTPCPDPDVHKMSPEQDMSPTGAVDDAPGCPHQHWLFDPQTRGWFHDATTQGVCVCECPPCFRLQQILRSGR